MLRINNMTMDLTLLYKLRFTAIKCYSPSVTIIRTQPSRTTLSALSGSCKLLPNMSRYRNLTMKFQVYFLWRS